MSEIKTYISNLLPLEKTFFRYA